MGVDPASSNGAKPRIVATYDYTDVDGRLLYQAVRFEPKEFRQRRPDGAGGWQWKMNGVEPVPYRLPELLTAEPDQIIFIAEGEKDADRLIEAGLVATTNHGGAGKWGPVHAAHLAGRRRAVALRDNDDAGQQHVDRVVDSLAGIVPTVRALALPDLPPKGDVSDWLDAGGSVDELLWLAEEAFRRPGDATGAPSAGEDADAVDDDLQPPVPFPVEALPVEARRLVAEGAAAIGVPPEFVAVPLLAFAAGAIGRQYHLKIKAKWREFPIVYAAVVGGPGSGKSPAQSLARHPLDVLQREAHRAFKDDLAEHRAALSEWEGTKPAERGEKPVMPTMLHYFTTDPTIEALAKLLEASPGVVNIRDELVSWVKSMDAYRGGRGGDRQKWLGGWSKDPLKIDRKSSPPIYVDDPCISVVGGIQPDILHELAHEAGHRDGFIERILWAYPAPAVVPYNDDDDIAQATLDAITGVFRKLRPEGRDPDEDSRAVELGHDARRCWIRWQGDNTRLTAESRGIIQGIHAKMPIQLARLALILHCLTHPERPDRRKASAATMEAAIAVVEYFRVSAYRVLPAFGQSATIGATGLVPRIAAILDAEKGGWIARSIIRDRPPLSRNVPMAEIDAGLRFLAEQGRAESRVNRDAGAGRPPEEWRSLVADDQAEEGEWAR